MSAPLVSAFGWTLLHSLWEGTLGVLATALVLRMLRGASPRARYAVAVAGLLLVAGLPLRHLAGSFPGASASVTQVPTGQGGRLLSGRNFVSPGARPDPAPVLRTRMAAGLERALSWAEWALPWVVGAWSLGALLSLLRLAGGWMLLQRLRWQKAELASDALQRQLLDLCRRAGLKRAVTLLTCEGLTGPSVVGALRPAILVPAGWFLNLPPSHVEALLAHELAHVLRHDYLVNLLQSLLEVLMFYHPGVWWLSKRIRAERELAADAFAARLLGDPLPLAEALTDLERRGLAALAIPAPAAHGGSLMERIASLLLPRPRTSSAPVFGALALVGLLLAGGLSLRAQTPDPTPAVAPDPTPTVAPVIPQGNSSARPIPEDLRTVFYLKVAKNLDGGGQPIPYDLRLTLKADQIPLYVAWEAVVSQLSRDSANNTGQIFMTRAVKGDGPRVNLDMEGATPGQVLRVFHELASAHGVAPLQLPEAPKLKPFSIRKTLVTGGIVHLDFHAKAVSLAYLDTLLLEAHRFHAAEDCQGGGIKFDRAADTGSGPKVDAIFEGLTLPELEARIAKLKAEAGH